MERNGTPIAIGGTVAVAVAALLFSPFASKIPSSKQASRSALRPPAVSQLASGSSSGAETFETLSRDDRGPWYALCQEFAGDEGAANPPAQQVEEVEKTVKTQTEEHKYEVHKSIADDLKVCKSSSANFQFLIAIVPDPIASHLNIEFDRAVESLQRAAAVNDYSFERYWFPWRPDQAGAAEDGSPTALRIEERLRQEQPGVLVFRKAPVDPALPAPHKPGVPQSQRDQLLLIFLVGETPTAGLNRPAFLKSLRYIEELTTNAPPAEGEEQSNLDIRIAGPSFSDTLPALGEVIDEYDAKFPAPNKPTFHIVNYGARRGDFIKAFQAGLPKKATFSSLDLQFKDAQKEWVTYLCTLGYQTNEMAVLSEDLSPGSASILAGRPFDTSARCRSEAAANVTSLSFPRDLSSIRDATASQDSSAAPQQIAGVNLPSIGVALTLRQDETNEHDAPPDFAQIQSSARVDRALQAMVKALRSRRIQAVLVSATNPMDRIFLLDYLHLTVPDVRLAVVGADDFMLARPQHIDLAGTLAVTSLPLMDTAVAVDSRFRSAINFSSNASEGMFLAAANLLGSGSLPAADATAGDCIDISIVGKTGFRPAIIQERPRRPYPCLSLPVIQSDKTMSSEPGPAKMVRVDARVTIGQQSKSSPIPFVWVMALICLLIVSTLHLGLVCSSNNWLRLGFLPRIPRLTLSSSGVRGVQIFFLLVATAQILLLEWIAVTTTLALNAFPSMVVYQFVVLGVHILLLLGSALLAGWLIFKTPAKADTGYSRALWVGVVASLAFVVCTALSWWLILNYSRVWNDELARLVALRAAYFLEGLSPLLPMFFVLLAYYLWSLNNLQRLWMVVTRVSLHVPNDKDNTPSREMADMIIALQSSIKRTLDLKPSTLALIVLTIVGCFLVRLWPASRGFEFVAFRLWLVTWGFVLLLLIIVIMFQRSWSVWLQLRKVLHFLDSALLGDAFSHVPKDISSTRVWSFGGARSSLMLQTRTAELLQRMAIDYPVAAPLAAAAGSGGESGSVTGTSGIPQDRQQESPFSALREMGHILDSGGVVDRPLAKRLSIALNSRMWQTAFLFDPEASAVSALPPNEKNILALYVAYRFVAFFRYVMRQLRNKLTFVIYGYTCLVVATAVYPFQGRESLGTLMTFVFVLLLGGVAAMMVQMYRDPILKQLEESAGGWSGTVEIAMKLVGVAGVPLCAVLASQFPAFAEVMLNWLRPVLEASH